MRPISPVPMQLNESPSSSVDDMAVVDAMKIGGLQVFDHAISQWSSGKYTDHLPSAEAHSQIRENYYKFQAMKDRVRELCSELKKELRK